MPRVLPTCRSGAKPSCTNGDASALASPTASKKRVSGLFCFIDVHSSLWKAVRTTNAIEQRNRGFRRRIKTQTLFPCAETVPTLFWALLTSRTGPDAQV